MDLTRRTLYKLVGLSVLPFPVDRDTYDVSEHSWHLERVSEDSDTLRIVFNKRTAIPDIEFSEGVVIGGAAGHWTYCRYSDRR